ncbi:hypothetical protein NpNSSI1_00001804 [Neofusicoccum parvum]|uniref:Uncharacterized protein n=1 Tax=Neofusicoccum parvum TaxID=310453 RepID=A0ACB5SFN6_9PEZI|nr:hypothetical protein NpPPO83_00010987 [Neofusicoccum parvum]GME62643.1 hypothetical protein NpNSSI1_00001804 [Neofusicoccum parvum]
MASNEPHGSSSSSHDSPGTFVHILRELEKEDTINTSSGHRATYGPSQAIRAGQIYVIPNAEAHALMESEDTRQKISAIFVNSQKLQGSAYGSPQFGATIMNKVVGDAGPDAPLSRIDPSSRPVIWHSPLAQFPPANGYECVDQKLKRIAFLEQQLGAPFAAIIHAPLIRVEEVLTIDLPVLTTMAALVGHYKRRNLDLNLFRSFAFRQLDQRRAASNPSTPLRLTRADVLAIHDFLDANTGSGLDGTAHLQRRRAAASASPGLLAGRDDDAVFRDGLAAAEAMLQLAMLPAAAEKRARSESGPPSPQDNRGWKAPRLGGSGSVPAIRQLEGEWARLEVEKRELEEKVAELAADKQQLEADKARLVEEKEKLAAGKAAAEEMAAGEKERADALEKTLGEIAGMAAKRHP